MIQHFNREREPLVKTRGEVAELADAAHLKRAKDAGSNPAFPTTSGLSASLTAGVQCETLPNVNRMAGATGVAVQASTSAPELCQTCLTEWGRESVLDPMYGCPRCDAPTLERDDTRDEMVRNALGRA